MMIRPGKPAKYGIHLLLVGALVFGGLTSYTYLSTPRGLAFEQHQCPADPLTPLRQYLTREEAGLFATLDGQDSGPDLEGKEALLLYGDYFAMADGAVIDFVVDVVESGMPVVLFGGGYYLLRQRIPDLPYAMPMVHIEDTVNPAAIAATVVKRYIGLEADGRSVYGLLQVQGAALSRGLVDHTLGFLPEIASEAWRHPGDDERMPTGYAWYSTFEDWRYYGAAVINRRYYKLKDTFIDDADRTWESRLLEVDIHARPGSSLWGSNWSTQGIRSQVDVGVNDKWWLQDYNLARNGPSNPSEWMPILPGPAGKAGSVVVHDYSDEAGGSVILYHELANRYMESPHVRIRNPGITYVTRQGQESTSQVVQEYRVFFAGKVWWWYGSAHSPRLILTDWNL